MSAELAQAIHSLHLLRQTIKNLQQCERALRQEVLELMPIPEKGSHDGCEVTYWVSGEEAEARVIRSGGRFKSKGKRTTIQTRVK